MSNLLTRLAPAVVQRGDFILRSGKSSKHYLDIRVAYGDHSLMKDLACEMIPHIDKRTTCLVGYGFGGIPLATAISLHGGFKLCLVRDKPKEHGKNQQIEGYTPREEDFLTIPDDVFTTGSSLKEATRIVQSLGAPIVGYTVVVNREEGDVNSLTAPLKFLYTAKQLIAESDRLAVS